MAKPRIIFVNRVYWPSLAATAQLLTDLAGGLVERGWIVHVIAAGEAVEEHAGVKIHRTGSRTDHNRIISQAQNYCRFIRRAKEQINNLAQAGDIVVLMTDPPMLGAALTRAAIRKGAHVIHWIQDIYPEVVSAHLGSLAALPLLPLKLKRNAAWHVATRCVVLGETMRSKVIREGVNPNRTRLIPNWAPRELNALASPTAVSEQRTSWNISEKFIVAYSGNLGRVHEFKAIVAAAEILQPRPEIAFVFIGTGARLSEVRASVAAKQLKNVSFLPPAVRENLAISLSAADIQLVTLKPDFAALVYPSKIAGVLAVGRPLIFIGPPEGEIAHLLRSEKCGASIAPNEGRKLAETILHWQANPTERLALGKNARATYEKLFTFNSVLESWHQMLGSLDESDPIA